MKKFSAPKAKFVTVAVLTMASFFVLSLQLLSNNLQNVFQSWGKNFQMSVYFDESASNEEINQVLAAIKSDSNVAEFEFFEQKKTYELFKSQMASYAPEIFQDDLLLQSLPLSVQIDISEKLDPSAKQAAAAQLKLKLKELPGVEEVSLGGELFARYTKINETISVFAFSLTAIVTLLSWFAMFNMMNQLISLRSEEVAIHELFGASNWQIRRRFYVEAFLVSLSSSILALVFLGLLFTYGLEVIERAVGFLNVHQYLHFYSLKHVVVILMVTPVLGLVAAHLSLKRLNTGWAAAKQLGH